MSPSASVSSRRLRLSERLGDTAWFGPFLGAVAGAGLSLAISAIEGPPSGDTTAVTVEQARSAIWSALALLFTSLSVVLAVVAMTAQNMVNRFSPRLLRVKMKTIQSRSLLIVFSFTASYVFAELVVNRTASGDASTPPAGLTVALVLFVLSAVVLIAYIGRLMEFTRVDRTVRWVRQLVVAAARHLERELPSKGEIETSSGAFDPPAGAADLVARSSGYVVRVDVRHLRTLAAGHGATIAIDAELGQLVTPGDRVGWIAGDEALDHPSLSDAAIRAVELDAVENQHRDVRFDLDLLVDIALTALPPVLNDPRTAVQAVDQLTIALGPLAEMRPGPRSWQGDEGGSQVLVKAPTLGELVDHAARRVLLYGAEDPTVVRALTTLARELDRVGPFDTDRRVAEELLSALGGD